ncbi:hypothetical protein WHR41_00378 [Cladosporium halotolerans]|uniref:Synaptobrevin n=1 Tax=Cladosporium halotolerans TaxID=1052096 RepID=A0AB34L7E7_9PEZI
MDPSQTLTLNRLLQRLDLNLLSADADPKLRYSQYERNRVGVNIEHARNLLLTLEKQSASTRAQIAQKQQVQADLQRKRELVKKLNARLQELNELKELDSESEEDDDEEDVATRPSYAPARPDVDGGLDAGSQAETAPPEPPSQQEMRSRKPLSAADNRSAASTTARENLFAGRKQHPDLETTEALMSHNRSEQDALTNGLLGLARALKESTVNFGSSLEQEKEIMKRAEGSLEKSSVGMEAASRRMGTLRRMSEGQGWWGRVKLYGCIFALWVFLFLIVFLGPKLRF